MAEKKSRVRAAGQPGHERSSSLATSRLAPQGPVVESIGPPDDRFEREADSVADAVVRGTLLRTSGLWAAASAPDDTIRRAPLESSPSAVEGTSDASMPSSTSETASTPDTTTAPDAEPPQAEPAATEAPAALLVDDESETDRGQMRKSEFLGELRGAVCAAVDEGLSGTGRTSQDCPWIDHWLGYYEGRSASQVETSLHRFAPETRSVTTAADYVSIIAARVRRSAELYATTGEVSGVPDEMSGAIAGGGVLAEFGGLFFKARPGGARRADPIAVRAQLGTGQPLPGMVRTRMESAFGASFAGVRLHTDATAARLSDRLNARAFTVGQHVAFGGGEFRPGTLVGDALIAHELAHVVQQRAASVPASRAASSDTHRFESDADQSALAAVAAMRSDEAHRGRTAPRVLPALRSGLALQRCSKSGNEPVEDAARFAEISRVLEQTPLGKEALKTRDKYSVPVRFVKGRYFYDPSNNTMVLDRDHDIARSALDFIHEMHHALEQNEGRTPDVFKLPRAEYIEKSLQEEALGTSKSIEAKMQLEGTTVDVSKAVFPLEPEYRAAYTAAVNAARAADPKLPEDELKRRGTAAGRQRVLDGHKNGEIVVSGSSETYPHYYGRMWDERHP